MILQYVNGSMEPTEKMRGLVEQFLAGIKTHLIDNPVTRADVCAGLEIIDSECFEIVNYLQTQGYPIALTQAGYYWASSAQELNETHQRLQAHVNFMLEASFALRGIQWRS